MPQTTPVTTSAASRVTSAAVGSAVQRLPTASVATVPRQARDCPFDSNAAR